ncbi:MULTISPECIES: RidA family protein [Bartonella]|uniref:RidA family protein n=1 Tax=Bartonella TaxID=773 RepID=UPI0018DE0E1C|nr:MULTISPECIES: RidA family protein [Bartonella]MBH9974625.1 RidA family protein [Bartonella choladocola]MBI0014232.1 RidA family protein [Bartonella sp. B10834G3]
MTIKRIDANKRMSEAVIYNGLVFLSGQVGSPGKTTKEQTVEALAAIDHLLKQAGTDKSRILSATIWLADMVDFDVMNEVWEAWLEKDSAPARATCEAQLASPLYRVEIIVTAAL